MKKKKLNKKRLILSLLILFFIIYCIYTLTLISLGVCGRNARNYARFFRAFAQGFLMLQIAAYYGRFCGAKRPQCEAERPGFLLI